MRTRRRGRLLRTLLLAGAGSAFVAGPALGRPFAQIGSSSARDRASNEWSLGIGYDFSFPALPIAVGVIGQTGSGITEGDSGRQFPVRSYLRARGSMLPAPGFRVYAGAGGGVATRVGGESAEEAVASGMGFGGFEVGRLHLEVQYQRDFAEEARTRWVTAVGLSF